VLLAATAALLDVFVGITGVRLTTGEIRGMR